MPRWAQCLFKIFPLLPQLVTAPQVPKTFRLPVNCNDPQEASGTRRNQGQCQIARCGYLEGRGDINTMAHSIFGNTTRPGLGLQTAGRVTLRTAVASCSLHSLFYLSIRLVTQTCQGWVIGSPNKLSLTLGLGPRGFRKSNLPRESGRT